MYLFNKDGGIVEIYSMKPNEEKFEKYKRECMTEQIPLGERVWGIETDIKEDVITPNKNLNMFGINRPIDLFNIDIDFKKRTLLGKEYHHLIKEYISENNKTNECYLENVLTNYIRYTGKRRQLMRVFDYNDLSSIMKVENYFVIPLRSEFWSFYTTEKDGLIRKKYIDGIISIPKDLYLLELLNQGHFHLIDENVSEQITKFDISNNPIKTYSLEELKEMQDMGISVNAYDNTLEQIKSSEKVLKYIK